jgi:hypothetical protein
MNLSQVPSALPYPTYIPYLLRTSCHHKTANTVYSVVNSASYINRKARFETHTISGPSGSPYPFDPQERAVIYFEMKWRLLCLTIGEGLHEKFGGCFLDDGRSSPRY